MKQLLVIAALIVIGNALFVFAGGLKALEHTSSQATVAAAPSAGAVDAFQSTLQGAVVRAEGQPKTGFTPQLFLKYFPGLAPTDFEGVQSNVGYYTIKDGTIVHKLGNTTLIPISGAGAITRQGIATLLQNVSNRTGINLAATGTMTQIMAAITKPISAP